MPELNDLAEANRLIAYLTRFEELMAALTLAFIDATVETLDSEINHALRHIADFADVRRTYLLLINQEMTHVHRIYIWGDRDFRREWGNNASLEKRSWLTSLLQNGQSFTLRAADLPEDARTDFGLKAEDIMMGAPLIAQEGVIGFIGMDWSGHESNLYDGKLLSQTGAFITGALERDRNEQAHINELKLMRALIDNVPDYLFAKDLENRFLLVNYSQAQMVEVESPDMMRGKTDFDFFPEDDAAKMKEDDRTVFSGKVIDIEAEVMRKDGAHQWLHITKTPYRDHQGNIVGLVGIGRDITERKRIEEIMKTNERLLRTVIDNTPALVYVKDTESRFLLGNKAIVQQLGLQMEEEMIGKTDFDFHPSELAEKYRADEVQIMESDQAMLNYEELSIHHETNTSVWYATNKIPLHDDSGKLIGLVGLNLNITERKRMEDEVKNKEQLLRTVIDNLPALVFVKDVDSRFMLANKGLLDQMGVRSEEEIMGKSDADFHTPELAAQYQADEQAIIASGQPKLHYEEQAYDQSYGEMRWLSSNKIPIRDDTGKVMGLVGINHDITERKRIEEVGKAKERLLRIVIDNLPSHVYVKDNESRFMLANKASIRHMGKQSEQEVLGKDDFAFHTPEIAQQSRANEVKLMTTGESLLAHEEEVIDLNTNTTIWLHTNKIPLRDDNGKMIGLVGINNDITERKRAESVLREAAIELEKRVQERTGELQHAHDQYAELQQQIIEAQKQAIQELSTPIIPILDQVIVMPLVGTVDSMRARDVTRALLAAITQYRAKVVILDITGVSVVDTEVANHLNKTMQAGRLKGAMTIVTGISDAVAETIVDLGIDWTALDTVRDLRSGLRTALERMGYELRRKV
jgi:PAS domain S-box-containing protein